MRYTLDIRPAARSCIDGAVLTRLGRLRLYIALNDLATIPDAYRTDPQNRQGRFFCFVRGFSDAGRYRVFSALVDDSPAAFGVFRVVYADLT